VWGGGGGGRGRNDITCTRSVRHILWTPNFARIQYFTPILRHVNIVRNRPSYLFKFNFDNNLLSKSWSRIRSLCSKFTTKILYTSLMSLMSATWPVRLTRHDLNTSKIATYEVPLYVFVYILLLL